MTQYGAPCGACASPTDIPVPANYTGDAKAEKAIYRMTTGQWFVLGGLEAFPYGAVGDIPVPADYNGDGLAEFAIYRPSNGQWFRRGVAPEVIQYGAGGACCDDVPVPADYAGDGMRRHRHLPPLDRPVVRAGRLARGRALRRRRRHPAPAALCAAGAGRPQPVVADHARSCSGTAGGCLVHCPHMQPLANR